MNDVKFWLLHFLTQNVRVCIELQYVEKVLQLMMLEPVPGGPDELAGLLNLAGKSIPVIDLALYLGLSRDKLYLLNTPILICSLDSHQIGIIVDDVLGLENVLNNDFQMRGEFDATNSPFSAVVTIENELSLLINVHCLMDVSLITRAPTKTLNNNLIKKATKKNV
jgi:purine-binding chemotaxis protein CheW